MEYAHQNDENFVCIADDRTNEQALGSESDREKPKL